MNIESIDRVMDASAFSLSAGTELTSKQWRRLLLYAGVLLTDSAIFLSAFVVANFIHLGRIYPADGLMIAMVLLPLYLFIGIGRKSYSFELMGNWQKSAYRAVGSLAVASVALLFVAFYLHAILLLSRAVFSIGATLSAALLVFSRFCLHQVILQLFAGNPLSELVICDDVTVRRRPGASVIDASLLNLQPNTSDPYMLDRLGRLLIRADRVIVECKPERRADWAIALKGANIRAEILTPEIDCLRPLGSGQYGSETTLLVSVGPLSIGSRALKRALDLSVSTLAVLLFGPLMMITAVFILMDSKGPIFFSQQRVGRGNRLFSVYKFRSMKAESADATGSKLTQRSDSRVTRVGRIIRATSIDELPQIFNVLKGDMSLVGPRPHALGALAGDQLYWEVDERYSHRHCTKPGITGLAQVRGFRGNTHQRQDLVNRLQADLDYIHGWTIWRDIRILFATIFVVLHNNAY